MRIAVFLAFFILIGCVNDPNLIQEFISNENQPVEQIKGAELLHTEDGKVRVRIVATKIERFHDQQPSLIFSNNLEVYFYNDSSDLNSMLFANDGFVNTEEKIMVAQNNVELISSDSKKLETEELIWDEMKDKIYTNEKVKITTDKEIVHGEGFISNSNFSQYSIAKIHGTFHFDNEID